MDQAHREIEPLLHAPRVGADDAVRGVGELDQRQQLGNAWVAVARRQVLHAGLEEQVLAAGEQRIQSDFLRHPANGSPQRAPLFGHVKACHRGPATRRTQQREQNLDRRRFSGAVGAQQTEDRAVKD